MKLNSVYRILVTVNLLSLLIVVPARAADKTPAVRNSGPAIPVEDLKKKYWELGDPSSVYQVVQHRSFVKAQRLELGVLAGIVTSDPFVADNNLGAMIGYHLSEVLQINIMGWLDLTGSSEALRQLQSIGTSSNSNPPKWLGTLGAEYSALYGKVSLFGSKIIHYDLHASLGLGMRGSESGNYFMGYFGIGQMFFVSAKMALRLDYRMTLYSEAIYEKVDPTRIGQFNAYRLNRGDVITLGYSFFI